MAASLSNTRPSDPVPSLDHVRPTPAKAGLRGDQIGPSLTAVITEAVLAHYGSVKETAFALDVDRSLMMREFGKGDFSRLDRADELAKASIFAAVHAVLGPLTTPVKQALHDLREIERRVNSLRQVLEHIA